MLACGIEPCAPRPNKRICRLSAAEVMTPVRPPMAPAGPTMTCWPSTTSGLGKRLKSPSSIIAWAPCRRLLGRLEDGHQRPLPRVAGLREQGGRADQPGHVHVVAAGVHHRHGRSRRGRWP